LLSWHAPLALVETLNRGGKEAESMASSFPEAMTYNGVLFPALEVRKVHYSKIYQQHCHRVYSLAFWITDNELAADQLAANTFLRAFAATGLPGTDQIDAAFLAEVRQLTPLGCLTLHNAPTPEHGRLCGNMKRVHLERAVVQLPATEKLVFLLHDVEGYEHQRIGFLLGLSEVESKLGLHQARLRIRQLVAQMA
jgi:RNA polymerase sigma-70 factor, ECF subfamily